MDQNNQNADLNFTATLQDNVSPTADQIEARLKKLGASKAEIKMFMTAYDQATPKIKQVQDHMNKLPKNHLINIQTNADQAHQKLARLREVAKAPITVTLHVKDDIDDYISRFKMKFTHLEYELKNSLRNMPITGGLLSATSGAANMLVAPIQSLTGIAPTIGAGGAAGIAATTSAFMYKSMQQNSQMEQNIAQLTTLLRSPARAQSEYNTVANFSMKTPFNMQDILQSVVRERATGTNPWNNNLPTGIRNVSNLAAGGQVPVSQAQAAISAANLGYFEQLNTITGRNIKQSDFVYGGTRTGQTYQQAITDVNKQYAGSAEAQMQTFKGLATNIQDAIRLRFVQPVGAPVFGAVKGMEKQAANTFGTQQFQIKLAEEVDKLQKGLIKVFQTVQQGKSYFTSSLEAPLKTITNSALALGKAFGSAFSGTVVTGVKYLAEAITTIVAPISTLAAKFPVLAQVAGVIKGLNMFGISTKSGAGDFFGGLTHLDLGRTLSGIKEFTSLMGKLSIYVGVKAFLDLKNANDQLDKSFSKMGSGASHELNKLKIQFDELIFRSTYLGKSIAQSESYGAQIATTILPQLRGKAYNPTTLGQAARFGSIDSMRMSAETGIKGTEMTQIMNNWIKTMNIGNLINKGMSPQKAMDTVSQDIMLSGRQLANELGISLPSAIKQASSAMVQWSEQLGKANMATPAGGSLAAALYQKLGGTTDAAKYATSPGGVVGALLSQTYAPSLDTLLSAQQGGPTIQGTNPLTNQLAQHQRISNQTSNLNKVFDFWHASPNKYGAHTADLQAVFKRYADIPTSSVAENLNLAKLIGPTAMQQGIKLPKFENPLTGLGVPNLSKSQISNLSNNQSVTLMDQLSKAAENAQQKIAGLNAQQVKYQNTLQEMSIAQEQAAGNIAHQTLGLEGLQHATDLAGLALQKFTLDKVNPLQRAMQALSQEMADYQQKNVVPVQRAQEDWNQTMLRTSNHLEDVSFALGKAQFQMGKFHDGMLVGENALNDQIQSLSVYNAKLDMLRLQNMGLQADLTKTQFHAGFTSTVAPLMGFSLQREMQIGQQRQQMLQDKNAITYGNEHYLLDKAARPLFQRMEMPFDKRMQGILSQRSIIDTGTLTTRQIQDQQYQEQLRARVLQEKMYGLSLTMRPLQDKQYEQNRLMTSYQLQTSKASDKIARNTLEMATKLLPFNWTANHIQNKIAEAQPAIDLKLFKISVSQGQIQDAVSALQQAYGDISANFNDNIRKGNSDNLASLAKNMGLSLQAVNAIRDVVVGLPAGSHDKSIGGRGGSGFFRGAGVLGGIKDTATSLLNPGNDIALAYNYVKSKLNGGVLGTALGAVTAAVVGVNLANLGSVVTSNIIGQVGKHTSIPVVSSWFETIGKQAPLRRLRTPSSFVQSRGGELATAGGLDFLLHNVFGWSQAAALPLSVLAGDAVGAHIAGQTAGKMFQWPLSKALGRGAIGTAGDAVKRYNTNLENSSFKWIETEEGKVLKDISSKWKTLWIIPKSFAQTLVFDIPKRMGTGLARALTAAFTAKEKDIEKTLAKAGVNDVKSELKVLKANIEVTLEDLRVKLLANEGPMGNMAKDVDQTVVKLKAAAKLYDEQHPKVRNVAKEVKAVKDHWHETHPKVAAVTSETDKAIAKTSTLRDLGNSFKSAMGHAGDKIGEFAVKAAPALKVVGKIAGGLLGALNFIPAIQAALGGHTRQAVGGTLMGIADILPGIQDVAIPMQIALGLSSGFKKLSPAQQATQNFSTNSAMGGLNLTSQGGNIYAVQAEHLKEMLKTHKITMDQYVQQEQDARNNAGKVLLQYDGLDHDRQAKYIRLSQQMQTDAQTAALTGPMGMQQYLDSVNSNMSSFWTSRIKGVAAGYAAENTTHGAGYKAISATTGSWLAGIGKQIDDWSKNMGLPLTKGQKSASAGAVVASGITAVVGAATTIGNLFTGRAAGGLVESTGHGQLGGGRLVRMVEEGHPEVVIPLAPHRKDRARSLLRQTAGLVGMLAGGTVDATDLVSKLPANIRKTERLNLTDILPGLAAGGTVTMDGIQGVRTNSRMAALINAANSISSKHLPYLWGGGHSPGTFGGPYDCSGAVSALLRSSGYFPPDEAQTSGWFDNQFLPGAGAATIYSNPGHVYMTIGGRAWGTSGSNPGGGAGWFLGGARPGFVAHHLPGLDSGVSRAQLVKWSAAVGGESASGPSINLGGIPSFNNMGIVGGRQQGILGHLKNVWQTYLNQQNAAGSGSIVGGAAGSTRGLSGAFSSSQRTFIATLAALTGLNPKVVGAWVAAEEPPGASSGYRGTQDWLNIGITDSTAGSGGLGAGNSVWSNAATAARATAGWLKGTWSDPGFGTASAGIQAILNSRGGSPTAQMMAIAHSGWASSGYNGGQSLLNLFAQGYAGGIPRVARDNTPAILHQGEAVLQAGQVNQIPQMANGGFVMPQMSGFSSASSGGSKVLENILGVLTDMHKIAKEQWIAQIAQHQAQANAMLHGTAGIHTASQFTHLGSGLGPNGLQSSYKLQGLIAGLHNVKGQPSFESEFIKRQGLEADIAYDKKHHLSKAAHQSQKQLSQLNSTIKKQKTRWMKSQRGVASSMLNEAWNHQSDADNINYTTDAQLQAIPAIGKSHASLASVRPGLAMPHRASSFTTHLEAISKHTQKNSHHAKIANELLADGNKIQNQMLLAQINASIKGAGPGTHHGFQAGHTGVNPIAHIPPMPGHYNPIAHAATHKKAHKKPIHKTAAHHKAAAHHPAAHHPATHKGHGKETLAELKKHQGQAGKHHGKVEKHHTGVAKHHGKVEKHHEAVKKHHEIFAHIPENTNKHHAVVVKAHEAASKESHKQHTVVSKHYDATAKHQNKQAAGLKEMIAHMKTVADKVSKLNPTVQNNITLEVDGKTAKVVSKAKPKAKPSRNR